MEQHGFKLCEMMRTANALRNKGVILRILSYAPATQSPVY